MALPRTSTEGSGGHTRGARWVSVLAGTWLFASAFLWPHTHTIQTNMWVIGALICLSGMAALVEPRVRSANTLLAIWLAFTSISLFHESERTLWNNLIVAAIVFVASLVPLRRAPTEGPRHLRPA